MLANLDRALAQRKPYSQSRLEIVQCSRAPSYQVDTQNTDEPLTSDTECWERQDKENKGSGYRGTQSETIMGEPCKTWKYTKFRESK